MKEDKELQELRRHVYSITGKLDDICYKIGGPYTLEEWKEHLREIVEKQEETADQ